MNPDYNRKPWQQAVLSQSSSVQEGCPFLEKMLPPAIVLASCRCQAMQQSPHHLYTQGGQRKEPYILLQAECLLKSQVRWHASSAADRTVLLRRVFSQFHQL